MKRQKRDFVIDDIYNLPSFLRIEVIDGEIYTDDWKLMKMYLKSLLQKNDI